MDARTAHLSLEFLKRAATANNAHFTLEELPALNKVMVEQSLACGHDPKQLADGLGLGALVEALEQASEAQQVEEKPEPKKSRSKK